MSEEPKEPDNTIMTGVGKDGELVTTDPNEEPEAKPEETPEEPAAVETPEETPETPADPEEPEAPAEAKPGEPEETPDPPKDPEETPETDEETEEAKVAAEAEKGPAPKKKDRFQKRVDKLTHDKRILEEENVRLRAGQQRPQAVAQQVEETEPPKESDFKTFEEFDQARIGHAVKQGIAENEQEKQHAAAEARNQQIVSEHYQRVEVAREKHDDWDEVAEKAKTVPEAVGALIYEHEAGAEILYHLAKNPEVAEKLWQMSTVKAVAEVGKLAASLTSSPANKVQPPPESSGKSAKSVSNATPPIKPVGKRGAHKTKRSLDDSDLTPEEFMKRRDQGENFRPGR